MKIKEILGSKGKRKLSMVTAYSYYQAQLAELAGIDLLLVGDSYGPMMLGYKNTIGVGINEMVQAVQAVRRGAPESFIVGDMPYMSYQPSHEMALINAGKLIEAGADAVKLEGTSEIAEIVNKFSGYGISVVGHIPFNPYNKKEISGYEVQGADEKDVKRLLEGMNSLEEAGAFGVVLDKVVEEIATRLTEDTDLLTFGFGSGRYCDGQVLLWHDLLGLRNGECPKFVKHYAELRETIINAIKDYKDDVIEGKFPGADNSFTGGEYEY